MSSEKSTEMSSDPSDPTVTTTYHVAGMSCGHCVTAVRDEVGTLAAVRHVDVALVPGGTSSVTVTSSAPLADDQVRAAVDEAGYELVEVPDE